LRNLNIGHGNREKSLDLYLPYPFSRDEYRERLDRVRAEMARKKIDVLFLSSPESLFYISGYASEWYQAQSPNAHEWLPASGIAVEVDHEDFIFFDTGEEEGLIRDTTVTNDARYLLSPEEEASRMLEWIAEELEKEGWLPGIVGLEMWSYRPNRAVSEMFQKELEKKGGRVVDATDIVRDVRWIKSPQEIVYIEKAARIADIGMNAGIESMRPGMTELEVYGEIVYAMAKAGGEATAIPVLVHTGDKGGGHALASRRKIKKGDIVGIDLCGVFNRYHANIMRSFSISTPRPYVARTADKVAEAFEVVGEVIKPNLPVAELNERMRAYYKDAEIDRTWCGGYELGIGFPPDWVGWFVYDTVIDPGDRKFVPGTVVNHESLGQPSVINTIIFGKEQARMLSQIPNELIII